MIPKPWQIDAEDYSEIPEYYPDFPFDDVVATYKNFYHNSYLVPCIAIFVIYGLFLLFVVGSAVSQVFKHFHPNFTLGRWWRQHISEHPLVGKRHAEYVSLPYLRWLTMQLPLRGDSITLVMVLLGNFLPIVAFYDYYTEDNVFWPGPTGKRDMLCRYIADRTALLGTACFPLLVLFASKRTPLAIFCHLEMSTLMLYHRWIARICWTHVLIHTVAFSVDYARYDYLLEAFKEPYFQWGCVAFGMMCGLTFFSLRAIRERWYELFVFMHIAMAVVAIVGVYLHIKLLASPKLQMFVLMTELAAAFWAFDRIIRLATRMYFTLSKGKKTLQLRCATTHVQSFRSGFMLLRIELPLSRVRLQTSAAVASWTAGALKIGAGDEIRITVPRVQVIGEHPFTILRAGKVNDSTGYVELLVKEYAGFTRKLALRAKSSVSEKDTAESNTRSSTMSVLVEGPFGTVPSLDNSHNAVLVAGGIAITYCWPMFVAAAQSVYPTLRSCKLIWIVRQKDMVDSIEEALSDLVSELETAQPQCRLMLDIYVTGQAEHELKTSSERIASDDDDQGARGVLGTIATLHQQQSGSVSSSEDLSPGTTNSKEGKSTSLLSSSRFIAVQWFTGRPSMSALHAHIQPSDSEKDDVHFAVCGPASLCDDVRAEALTLLSQKRQVRISQDCFSY